MNDKHGEPYFLWVHYFDPHDDYWPPPDFAPEGLKDRERQMEVTHQWLQSNGAKYHDEVVSLYDAEISYMDFQIGRLLDDLEENCDLDNSIIVVIGDHGEGLFDHGVPFHGFRLYPEDLSVPLIVYDGGTDLSALNGGPEAVTLDVTPTVLDLLGLDIPEYVQGRSLVQPGDEGRYVYSVCFPEPLREVEYCEGRLDSIMVSGEQLILKSDSSYEYTPPGRLPEFPMVNNFGEQITYEEFVQNRIEVLTTELERYLEEVPKAETSERTIDEETMKALKDLGYL
ncbi:MAG: sulfatase-like hydrolase/transferase [Candidatus Dadabacteria bacterium]|nr:sulfatase-like hydrolase/transferase [Candidatus Dadabacteria bacterium]